jgi:hypothetical protein
MHTKEWSFEAGYCKIKTARQKKRLQKKDFDKQLIRLDRFQASLYQRTYALPMVLLKEPYQKGWKRSFILREDVTRCGRADFYRTLLGKINTIELSNDKSFKKKKKRKRKIVYEVKLQFLKEFDARNWHTSVHQLTDLEKRLFYLKEYWSQDGKTMWVKYVFSEPWRFVLQVKPNMITHTKMVDELLEQQIQEVRNYIDSHHLRPRMQKATGGKNWNSRSDFPEKLKYKNILKNKPLYRILEAAYNDHL